jgi:hypothetical protein
MTRFLLAIALCVLLVVPVCFAVDGVVTNKSTNQPQAGVTVKLLRLSDDGSASLVAETRSDAQGRFEFAQTISGIHGLEAEYQGVEYSQIIPPMLPPNNLQFSVYEPTHDRSAVVLDQHIYFLEPGQSNLVVSESYILQNGTERSFQDPARGSLEFELAPEAKGIVQVSFIGPDQRPREARTASMGTNRFRVNEPIPPGESRVDLNYVLPYGGGEGVFQARSLARDGRTRLVAPTGVELQADGLVELGVEPRTQARIFGLGTPQATIAVRGTGSIAEPEQASTRSEGPQVRSTHPALYDNLKLITVAGALAMLFALLLLYRRPQHGEPGHQQESGS